MNRIFLILCFSVLLSPTLFSQTRMNAGFSVTNKADSAFHLTLQTTNFGQAKRVFVELTAYLKNDIVQKWNIDPVILEGGINLIRKDILIKSKANYSSSDSIRFSSKIKNTKNQLLHEGEFWYLPKLFTASLITINDSSISITNPELEKLVVQIKLTSLKNGTDSLNKLFDYSIKSDTLLTWSELIKEQPFIDRRIEISSASDIKKTFYYSKGKFQLNQKEEESSNLKKLVKKQVQFGGSVEVESNFFSTTPQHSNGSQYPFTSFRAFNTVSIYGIPLTVSASHSTNDNISPNFRNFFSVQFDAASFRENAQRQLEEKKLSTDYSLTEISTDLEKNKIALQNLENAKDIVNKFPNENIELDSILKNEFAQADYSLKQDSLFGLDSLVNDSVNPDLDYTKVDSITSKLDSSSNAHQEKLQRIQQKIDQLEKSNALKEKYFDQLKATDQKIPTVDQIKPNELFTKFDPSSMMSLLLRFEKLEIGNFYEYAGQYSIRDIEMKGVNTTLLLNATNKVNFLTGKVNDFQSFNLDDIQDSKKVTSVSITNFAKDYFRPSVRLTQFSDETIDSEQSNSANSYFVMSAQANGEVSSWFSYQAEVNQSNEALTPVKGFEATAGTNMSYFVQSYITPLSFIDVKLQYERVGSNYMSDGVYFLNRNSQMYSVGAKLRLFKNKLHLKNDFTIIERNVENKSLTNKTQKQFFDVGTHFKRIPNIQISYSPISVEVANKLDTSFSGINANTNVLIARLFYFKKVKKTILSTALVYNEIENELADNFSTQKGIQHFLSISNDKINFSFTSAYNKTFSSVRFVSASYAQAIGKKLRSQTSFAKNFENNFYSEIIRSEVSYQFLKQFNLGLGGIFLIEEKSNFINSGGSVSLRFNY